MIPVERNKQQQSIIDYYTSKTENVGDDTLITRTSSAAGGSSNNGSTLSRKNSTMLVILMVLLAQTLIFGTKVITIANEIMVGETDDAGKEQMVLERQNDQQQQQQVSRMYPPQIPSFPPGIFEIIKSTNSSDYTWLGNQFVPPPCVPIFTPSQIRTYFQQRNVLMLGDSTNRRAHGTLLAIFNAEDLDDVHVAALDEVHRRRRLAAAAGSGTHFDCGPRNNKLSISECLLFVVRTCLVPQLKSMPLSLILMLTNIKALSEKDFLTWCG